MNTEEQKMDRARLKSYIEREQLSGVLNDTKWNKLFAALEPIRNKLDFLRKDVRDPESSELKWDSDFYHVFGGWENIEWICIRAKLSIPQSTLLEPIIKVWGYLRPGVSPEWEQ